MSITSKSRPSVLIIGLYYYDYVKQSYGGFEWVDGVDCLKPAAHVARLLKKITLSQALNSILKMPLQGTMFEWDLDDQSLVDKHYDVAIVMESPEAFSREYLKRVRAHSRKLCMVMLNPVTDRHNKLLPRVEDMYDLIVTCNPKDAKQNERWIYHPDCYSYDASFDIDDKPYDLSFISVDKGRGPLACEIYERAIEVGMKCDFLIVNPTGETKACAPEGIELTERPLPYEQCLRRSLRAKCILEIVANNQNYSTLRTMESVVYGRYLLTTNCSISEDGYYDGNAMQIIDNPDCIDWGLVKRGSMSVKGDHQAYSVEKLLEMVSSRLWEG